jgi:hypothetical protein
MGTTKHVQVDKAKLQSGAGQGVFDAACPGLGQARPVSGRPVGEAGVNRVLSQEHAPIMDKIMELYTDLFLHDGFGKVVVEMRFLKRGQKEIIVSSGKEFRFVVAWSAAVDAERE